MNRIQGLFLALVAGTGPVTEAADSRALETVPPAQVTHPVAETHLTTVTLALQAEKRLGIVTVPVQRKSTSRTRLLGGNIVLPMGIVKTDAGTPSSTFAPDPPASPTEVLRLSELQTRADGEIQMARVQLEAAQIRKDRAEKLLRAESGSQRDLDDARAAVQLSRATLEVATNRRALLGAPVQSMAKLDHAWVRVPVYVGDIPLLNKNGAAQVGGLGDLPGSPTRSARLAAGPPSSDPTAATVDWFYQVDNRDKSLRLGQRVGIAIPMQGEEQSLVIPWAAVVHDVQGGQWVYEKVGPQTYARRRIGVARVVEEEAILTTGPKPGAEVVTDGAAELFGVEFGAGH